VIERVHGRRDPGSGAFLGATLNATASGGKQREHRSGAQLIIGRDDDRQDNPLIQAGAATKQSLNRTVAQVFCSQNGAIAFADLTQPSPVFEIVSQQDVEALNRLVGSMIR